VTNRRMIYGITKVVEFEASHVVNGLCEGHKCGRLHGHNFVATITLEADRLDETGMVVDFGEIKDLVKEHLDHHHLNDRMGKLNPTAENIALYISQIIFDMLFQMQVDKDVRVTGVHVSETRTGQAFVRIVEDAAG
jgi:6-pyruvoyltetrahydropterin/6-carboxytetrahydropterin synthase